MVKDFGKGLKLSLLGVFLMSGYAELGFQSLGQVRRLS
jgi:hypothetical protein